MVGAHLDSVSAGPGINDNGSGSAAILEVAEQIAEGEAAEHGALRLVGRGGGGPGRLDHLRQRLCSDAELDRIALYLNFDMVGSPNFVRFVTTTATVDLRAGPPGGPPRSRTSSTATSPRGLEPYDDRVRRPSRTTRPFIDNGIPAGGLFTGAEVVKTAEQAAIWGGTAGVPFDPCYHQACDTFENNTNLVLDQMSDAIAHATITFAQNTSLVNGVPGKGNFNSPEKINGQAVR